jgi:hypothetical protein
MILDLWFIMKMTKKYDKLNDTFNVSGEIVSQNRYTAEVVNDIIKEIMPS